MCIIPLLFSSAPDIGLRQRSAAVSRTDTQLDLLIAWRRHLRLLVQIRRRRCATRQRDVVSVRCCQCDVDCRQSPVQQSAERRRQFERQRGHLRLRSRVPRHG